MKLQVIVSSLNKTATKNAAIEVTVGAADTVFSLLERLSSVTNTMCFPDQKLHFNGNRLSEDLRLSASEIKDGDTVELSYEASDDTLVKQLSDLLGDKALSMEELGLLYIHRHLAPVTDALKALGHATGKLQHFLADQKHFSIEGNLVKVQRSPKCSASPRSPTQKGRFTCILQALIAVSVEIEIRVPGKAAKRQSSDEDDLDQLRLDTSGSVAQAKEIIAAYNQIPFPDCDLMLEGQILEGKLSLHEAGISEGANLVIVVHASQDSLTSQLEALLLERVGLSPNELSLHYCQRFGTPVSKVLRTLGLPSNLKAFLEGQPQFSIAGGCVTLASGPKVATPPPQQDKHLDKTHIQYYTEKALKGESINAAGPPCVQ